MANIRESAFELDWLCANLSWSAGKMSAILRSIQVFSDFPQPGMEKYPEYQNVEMLYCAVLDYMNEVVQDIKRLEQISNDIVDIAREDKQ